MAYVSKDDRFQELDAIPKDELSYWDWIRYGPFLAQVVVIRRCNLSCAYCSEFDGSSPPVPFEDLQARFEKLRELKAWAVCLTGGEPTLHPRLPDLVAELKRLGFPKRIMITNGGLLSRDLIESLNSAGLTDLQISVDGVSPNEQTVKVLNGLRKNLDRLAELARFRVVMSGVVGSAPPEEALEVIDFARERGFIPRVLLIHDETGRMKRPEDFGKIYQKLQARLGSGFNEAGGYRDRLIREGKAPFKCRAGSRYLYVDEFGTVHWCSQTRGQWTRDLSEYTLNDLREQFYHPKPCHEACTVGCVRTASAFDQWREQ